MNCNEFEILLADALGDELSPVDRPAFGAHLESCNACRREYDSLHRALADLRSLPATQRVSLNDDTVISVDLAGSDAAARLLPSAGPKRKLAAVRRTFAGGLRYAASLLLAFTAGYALHVGITLSTASPHPAPPGQIVDGGQGRDARTLEAALIRVHTQQPMRSDLAKAMIALVPRR